MTSEIGAKEEAVRALKGARSEGIALRQNEKRPAVGRLGGWGGGH